MAKKKRKNFVQPTGQENVKSSPAAVPKFEIGKKGDEFDIKYTRAASASKSRADALLRNLSKETRAAEYNLINAAVLVLALIVLSMSFAFLSRRADAPKMRVNTLLDGSYTAQLSEYYRDTLPFGNELKSVWAFLGFAEKPEPLPDEPVDTEDPIEPDEPDDPGVTPPVTSEPPITTAPPTTEEPTSAPITEPTETTLPETRTMYAKSPVNIRLQPNSDSMIMGYFDINNEVDVVELRSDGWAEILYNGIPAYISADYLVEETVATTRATRRTNTEPTTEETTEEVTTTPEETSEESTAAPDETEAETTTRRTLDPELSKYVEQQSILESKRLESSMRETEPTTEETAEEVITTPEETTGESTAIPDETEPEPAPTEP